MTGGLTGYVYDGAGIRVAKGGLTSFSCNFASNGYATKKSWVLGPGGEQVTEYSVSAGVSSWAHTNVFAGSKLDATYNGADTYFALSDWLGTKRVEVDAAGACATGYRSLPFGDGLALAAVTVGGVAVAQCATDATEQHFTGKERDAESGNDYFGARYFASAMGRWLSPDWSAKEEPVPYAKLDDPQTLNLYGYVGNNPVGRVDGDGHACAVMDSCLSKLAAQVVAKVEKLVSAITGPLPDAPAPAQASVPKAPGVVNLNGHTVSNGRVKSALSAISQQFGSAPVEVTSGDRDFIPKGGSVTSAHLDHNAADFHVSGSSDSRVDSELRSVDSPVKTGFNVIQHGTYTATEGPHIEPVAQIRTGV